MPMWRCPHCGTPQAEAARCWVCRRSSTSCATCLNFRQAVFGPTGYCALDRHRAALVGDEIRDCWTPQMTLVAESVPVDPIGEERPFTELVPLAPLPTDPPTHFWIELER
jgi:hypothetical protein